MQMPKSNKIWEMALQQSMGSSLCVRQVFQVYCHSTMNFLRWRQLNKVLLVIFNNVNIVFIYDQSFTRIKLFLVLKLTRETCQAFFLINIFSLSLDLLGLSKYRPSSSRSSLMPQHSLGCDIIPPTKPPWSMELSRKGIGTVTFFLFYVVLSQANLNSELIYQFKKY